MKVVAIDFETAYTNGEPALEYWRPDFRAISCAFTDDSGSWVYFGERDIFSALLLYSEEGPVFVAHNLQFEMGVMKCRFPGFVKYLKYDTARLAQMADNGGKYNVNADKTEEDIQEELINDPDSYKTGLSLQGCVSRFLPESYHNHKAPYHALIRARGGEAGKEGKRLDLLEQEELMEYNKKDAEVTLALFIELTKQFDVLGVDWEMDHILYHSSVCKIVESKIRGVPVDVERLKAHCEAEELAMSNTAQEFRKRFYEPIKALESEYTHKAKMCRKTLKGQERVEDVTFNPLSTKQLSDLFVDKLGMFPKFITEKGAPSFKSKFLRQWGEGGEILSSQRTHLVALKQGQTLLDKTGLDGRWHIDLRATGTITNRFAGAGGLNVQGMSRRCESLMSCLVVDTGYTLVSIDLSAGEPTVTTHYSGDTNYYNANLGMLGKKPYYNKTGLLQISDIYLMTASVSPFGKDEIKRAFNLRYGGTTPDKSLSFSEQWVKDPEVIKKALKKCRELHKTLCLGLSYGMGPKKLLISAYEIGEEITKEQATMFWKNYWKIFKGVRKLDKALSKKYATEGRLQTAFGYCCYPDAGYKCLNAFIQASVSGIMHTLNIMFFDICNFARFVTVIHDEVLIEIPTERLEEAKQMWNFTVDMLNKQLNWSVAIRTGWVEGGNWFDAK